MGSLQDQLLAAGLATPEQLRKARAEQRRERRREPRGRRDAQDASRTPPGRRPPGRGRKQPEPSARPDRGGGEGKRSGGPAPGVDTSVPALNLRIRELLDRHAVNDRNAEIAFNFTREGVVRRVYVTDEQRRKLAAGELALVGFRRRHHVVPAGVADEIQALRPIVFVHRAAGGGGGAPAGDAVSAEDDPYRDFPVPDDLHW